MRIWGTVCMAIQIYYAVSIVEKVTLNISNKSRQMSFSESYFVGWVSFSKEENETKKNYRSYLAPNQCWVAEAVKDEQRWSWSIYRHSHTHRNCFPCWWVLLVFHQIYIPSQCYCNSSCGRMPPRTLSIFTLPFNMVNTSTFLSLKTIKLHNKKWKRPETMKRVRHDLFFHQEKSILSAGC